jgi:hypothetical protein
MKLTKTVILSGYILLLSGKVSGQSIPNPQNVITTTVPFLLITPDARSGGLGDAGVAISPDANTIHWNPAKLADESDNFGVSVNYTPWLRAISPDMSISYIAAFIKLNSESGLGASFRYFSLGDVSFTTGGGSTIKTYQPYEYAGDLAYARKISEHISLGIAGRYIYSDLSGTLKLPSGDSTHPAEDFAGDISAYYTNKIVVFSSPADLAFGVNISNIGGKITYTDAAHRDFISTNLKIGGYLNIHANNNNNAFGIALDLNKLLVPTPGNRFSSNPSVIQGMMQSFYDAPGGFKEEAEEIDPSIGFEYKYKDMFAARTGFLYEAPGKGNRQYLTFGIGGRYKGFCLDLAYLLPTNNQTMIGGSPLNNTLRFTIGYYLADKKKG